MEKLSTIANSIEESTDEIKETFDDFLKSMPRRVSAA